MVENVICVVYNQLTFAKEVIPGRPEKGGKMQENMTDKQLEVILNLVADKFESCENMEEVKKAVDDVRKMAKKEKTE